MTTGKAGGYIVCSQPYLPTSRPKQTILNDAGWSTPQSGKNQPGTFTYFMQFAGCIWPQVIVAKLRQLRTLLDRGRGGSGSGEQGRGGKIRSGRVLKPVGR